MSIKTRTTQSGWIILTLRLNRSVFEMKLGVGEELIEQYVVGRHAVELGTTSALIDVTDDLGVVDGDRLPDEVYKYGLGR
jgi:hypothetical protein